MQDLPSSLPFEMQNRFRGYSDRLDKAFEDLDEHPEYLVDLFQAIAGNEKAREISADWTHRFVTRLISEKAYPAGTAIVIRALGSNGLLNHSEQESLAIRAIEAGMQDGLEPLLQVLGGVNTLLEGMTPLHWACQSGQLEIAQFLTNLGASWSRTNAHGEQPIELVESKNKEPFTLLEQTTYPPGISKQAIHIFKTYREATPDTLDQFFQLFEQEVSLPQLTWMKDNASMVQLIFQLKYAINPNDPLLLRGLDFCRKEKIITEDITDTVQRYESMMTTRNVAHIIGDATIAGRSEDHQKLEGHRVSQTIPLLQATIGRILAKYGNRLDDTTKEILEQVNAELTPSIRRSLETEALCTQAKHRDSKEVEENRKHVQSYAAKFLNELQQVPTGGKLILPWGWRGTSRGHAMLMDFTRTAPGLWSIDVLNTGAGMEFGSSMIFGGKEKQRFLTAFENVTDEELLDSFFLERLLEPQLLAEDLGPADLYLAILDKHIGHHKRQPTKDDADISEFITGQRSGTCAFRVLSSFMRLRLGKESYKKFKHLMHLETATAAFSTQREAFRTKPERRRLLQDGLANIARQALKLHKGGIFSEPEFRVSSAQIRNLQKEMESVSLASGHSFEVGKSGRILGSRQVKGWMDQLKITFPEKIEEKPVDHAAASQRNQAIQELTRPCTNAQELLRGLNALKTLGETQDDVQNAMANFFIDLPYPDPEFIRSLKELSAQEARTLLSALDAALAKPIKTIYKPFPNTSLAFQIAYGLAYTLACCIDEKTEHISELNLNNYRPDPKPLKKLRENPYVIFGDSRIEDKALQLQRYFESLTAIQYNPLFSFINWSVVSFDYSAGLALPPPARSAEDTFMSALKRRVGSWDPRYDTKPPKDIGRYDWYDAQLFHLLTPEKAHIDQYRRIYLQSRLCVFAEMERDPFKLEAIGTSIVWARDNFKTLPNILCGRMDKEDSKHHDHHRSLRHLDKGNLSIINRVPENEVCLRLPRELRSLWSIRSQAEVTLPRLLQHFEDHLSDLEGQGIQEFFNLTLFHFGEQHLRKETLRNPAFKQRLDDFLEKRAFPFFLQRITSTHQGEGLASIGTAAIFLLVVQARVGIYFGDNGMVQRSIQMLRSWSSVDDARCPSLFKEPQAHRAACQSLIQALMVKPNWTNEETESAFAAFAASTYLCEHERYDPWLDPRREFDVNYAFWQHRVALSEKLSNAEFRQKTLAAMVRATSIPYECREWHGAFPVYTADVEKGVVKVNVLDGSVFLNDVQMKQIRLSSRASTLSSIRSSLGRDVYDYLTIDLGDYPTTLNFIKRPNQYELSVLTFRNHDGQKLLTVKDSIGDGGVIEIDCRGRTYQTLPDKAGFVRNNFPIRYTANEVIFAVSKDEGPRSVLVLDRKLNRIGLLTQDGLWIQNPDDPANQPQAIAVNEKLEVENQNGWNREEGSDPNRVILKKFDPAQKNYATVEFSREPGSGRLIWKGDRGVRYYLSDDQTLTGMGQRTDYVILEDHKGKRKAYFLGEKLYEIDKLTNRPSSMHPEENARFAHYAMQQGEYVEALHFLDQMTLSPTIGYEALKELRKIFSGEDKDENPNSLPLRIKAAHIAMQALRKRPFLQEERRALEAENLADRSNVDKIPIFDYWSEKETQIGPPLIPKLINYFSVYFSVDVNIDERLKLPQSIGKDEVTAWLLDLSKKNQMDPAAMNAFLALIDANRGFAPSHPLEPIDISALAGNQAIYPSWRDLLPPSEDAITDFAAIFPKLRPGKTFQDAFNFLYLSAINGTAEEKKKVQQVVDAMYQGARPVDKFFGSILEAILHPERCPDPAQAIRTLVDQILTNKEISYYHSANDVRFNELKKAVDLWKRSTKPKLKLEERRKLEDKLAAEAAAAGEVSRLLPLPSSIPASVSGRIAFNTHFPVAPFAEIRLQLVEVPVPELPIQSLPPPVFESEYAERRFNALNQDYQKGQILNRHPHYRIDDAAIPGITKTLREALNKTKTEDLKTPFVALANTVPPESLAEDIHALEVIGGVRTPLSADECILAFLREDTKIVRSRNPHLFEEDANKVRQMVGEYLCHTLEVWRLRQSLERAEAIQSNKNPALRDDLVELFRQSLDGTSAYDPTEFPAFLVFEYYGSEFLQSFVRLLPNQVQGIKDMIARDATGSYPDLALQRIMGAGKTFVFGTLMALLKADGYHLSMHVPPSALFGTNTSDMLQRVARFFQQRGHALHFTRAPEHFDEPFLKNLYRSLHKAILNREVVLASPETLLSLRNRYIEMRDSAAEKSSAALGILEDILKLLRQRGVATLDEIDVTLAPNKEHNFPVGEGHKLDSDANRLIEKIFLIAATDPEIAPILKLKENQQSHLSVEQRKAICSHIAYKILDYLVHDDKWKGHLLLWVVPPDEQKAEIEILHAYLMDENLDPPPLIQELHRSSEPLKIQLAEYFILLRKELRDWLPQGWERNLQEHYGRSHKDPSYPLARPYMANNTPNETSEFADRWEMINRTFHTYLAEGLNKQQTRDWIGLFRKEAAAEWALEDGSKGLGELSSALAFEKITGKKLFEFDMGDDEQIEEIQKTLTNGSAASIETVLNHARQSILDQVEMPVRQVSSNAQSLCSLFKTAQGYAGTMECADTFPDRIHVELDKGTNGKTIDLLHRKNTPIHIIKGEAELLREVVANHPQMERVHAIIDVGAYFRGQSNAFVARHIAEMHGKVKGVIYFEEENNWPTFIFSNDPDHPITLPAMDPQSVSLATGLTIDEIFTYYDQRNITGVDIKQSFDAIAIATISENSSIREVLQGVGRMRGLQYSQTVEFAVTESVASKMKHVDIPNLVVFTAMNETEQQMRYNLHSVILKLNNAAQDVVLEAIFNESTQERKNALYAAARMLFTKVVEAELWGLYAEKAKPLATLDFLDQVKGRLLDLVKPLVAPETASSLENSMIDIITRAKDKRMLPATIDGSQAMDASREATMEQEQTRVQEQERKQEQKKEVVQTNVDSVAPATESGWEWGVIKSPNFPRCFLCPPISTLEQAMNETPDFNTFAPLFDANIDLTLNFRQAKSYAAQLLTANSKEAYIILAIEQNGQWRFLLGSLHDMAQLRKQIEDDGKASPLSVYMLNPNGKLVTDGKGNWKDVTDPKGPLMQGLAQIMIFQGNVQALSNPRWLPAVQHWLSSGNQDLKKTFLENHALQTAEAKQYYQSSRLREAVNATYGIETDDIAVRKVLSRIEDPNIMDPKALRHYLWVLQQAHPTENVRKGIEIIVERMHRVPEIIVRPEPPKAAAAEEPKPEGYLSSVLKWFSRS